MDRVARTNQPMQPAPQKAQNTMGPPSNSFGFSVSSLGSADSKFQEWQKNNQGAEMQTLDLKNPGWGEIKLNPIMDSFASMLGGKAKENFAKNPQLQAQLFDADNGVKSNSGIFRKGEDGLQKFGVDKDGQPLFAAPEFMGENFTFNFGAGKNQIQSTGKLMDMVGAFKTKEEADKFTHFTNLTGSPQFQGQLSAQIAEGDHKGAINNMLGQLGVGSLDSVAKDGTGLAQAFTAHNLVNNWDSMNAAQRSMSMSAIAMNSFTFDDGATLKNRTLIDAQVPGGPKLTTGDVGAFAGMGINVQGLMKNWDQVDGLHRLTQGRPATSAQLAQFGKRMNLFGGPDDGDSGTPGLKPEQLAARGFTSAPSVGMGGIVGPSDKIPDGYAAVGAGTKPNTIIAVPKTMMRTAATINGTDKVSSLNSADGLPAAGPGAFKVAQNWGKTAKPGNGAVGGTSFANGMQASGMLDDPYVMGSVAALSLHGNTAETPQQRQAKQSKTPSIGDAKSIGTLIAADGAVPEGGPGLAVVSGVAKGVAILGSDAKGEDKAKALRRTTEDGIANYMTGGAAGAAQQLDQKYTGGTGAKARELLDNPVLNPAGYAVDKIGGKILGSSGGFGGGKKNKDQKGRDSVRSSFKNVGLADDKWEVTLADGSRANIGMDGHGDQHEFRSPEKVPAGGEVRTLSSFDVDYTNDLDYTSNMMTSTLARLVSGGKGVAIDQMGGQLANAALKTVGFGQDMDEETFGSVQANARKMFADAGIKNKEDAYALLNQGGHDARFAEMDLVTMKQGIDIAFDDTGYQTAQTLMEGRWKGLEVAHEVPNAPGPNMQTSERPIKPGNNIIPQTSPEGIVNDGMAGAPDEQEVYLKMEGGNYWGPQTKGMYDTSMKDYKDPWIEQVTGGVGSPQFANAFKGKTGIPM
jgi:hypothetical protein